MRDGYEVAAWRVRPSVEVVTAPTGAVLSLHEVRAHVAQPLPDDDLQLQALVEAAQRVVESRLARPVLTQTRRAWFDCVPGPVVRLSEPATSIVSVMAYDTDDAAQPVSGTVYRADLVSQPARLVLRHGQTWPTGLRTRQALAVEYTTGWDRAQIPGNVRQAVALLAAHWYEHRQPVHIGGALQEVPFGIDALLQPHCLALGVA
jgi:uncharacterized phiE125 gp8 family phage protein